MNRKVSLIVSFLLGGLLFSTISVSASYLLNADEVALTSTKTETTNLNDSLDELYTIVNEKVTSGGSGVLKVVVSCSGVLAKNGSDNGVYYDRTSTSIRSTLTFTIENGVIKSVSSSNNGPSYAYDSWDAQYARIALSFGIESYQWIES